MASLADDLRAEIEARVAEARRDFASDVDGLLEELRIFSAALGDVLGEVSREEAVRALRRFVLQKFDQRLALRASADPRLPQLVREAFDLLTNPETQVDLRDWTRAAEPFVR